MTSSCSAHTTVKYDINNTRERLSETLFLTFLVLGALCSKALHYRLLWKYHTQIQYIDM